MPRPNLSVPPWWRSSSPAPAACYPTKTALAKAIADRNIDLVEHWGGLERETGPGEFDSLNEKLELRGRRKIRSLGQAIWAAIPAGKPFCHEAVDWGALNETTPAAAEGYRFEIPDEAIAEAGEEGEARYWRELQEQEEDRPRRRRFGSLRCKAGEPPRVRPCSDPGAAPFEAVYRPRLKSGRRPTLHVPLRQAEAEDPAPIRRRLRRRAEKADRALTDFDPATFGANPRARRSWPVDGPPLPGRIVGPTEVQSMPARDSHGRFIRRHRRNPGTSQALLVNPTKRRYKRRNPCNPRRRSYRRNPGDGISRGGIVLGSLGYGFATIMLRRFWVAGATTADEMTKAQNSWQSWKPWLELAAGLGGYFLSTVARPVWKGIGLGLMAAGLGSGARDFLAPIAISEVEKRLAPGGAIMGLLGSGTGSLAEILVERERAMGQLAAGVDSDQELTGTDDEIGDEEPF